MSTRSLFWHDYETFGTDPQRDKVSQFAGIRTDLDFNIIADPVTLYCKPSIDCLPHPEACMITGITPQLADEKGVCEAEFIRIIHQQLAQQGTCTLGYNNIRFDDEVTRNLLYRNFYDPYAREWQNDNSRWDLIDVVRAARALRPDGIEWPQNEEGKPSFRLEALTQANGLEHLSAHDALSDVYATIAVARLIRQRQPRLYEYLFSHRQKSHALNILQLGTSVPVVHISGKYPALNHCLAVVLPVCQHPQNGNGVIVYDLSVDPSPLLELDAVQIRSRVFTSVDDLPEGIERIPLKTVHVNKCPVLAPVSVIRKVDEERLGLDLTLCDAHLDQIKAASGLSAKLTEVFRADFDTTRIDPDLMIYSGGFFSHHDKKLIEKIRNTDKAHLAELHPDFQDPRLPEMLFRFRARNYPETLSEEENRQWMAYCRSVMTDELTGARLTLQGFVERVKVFEQQGQCDRSLAADLMAFAKSRAQALKVEVTL